MMGGSSEFMFWKEKIPEDHLHYADTDTDDATDFQVQRWVEDQHAACSPPSWKQAPHDYNPKGYSPWLQSHLSPKSRLRAMKDGRREIMEMVKDMPESSYELSLKDILDEQQNMEEVQEKKIDVKEEKKEKQEREPRIPQKSKNEGKSQICRTESMESEVYLLKMFFPVSLSFKKKTRVRKSSRICSGPSSDGSERKPVKDWWKMIFLAVKDYRESRKIKRTSDISNNRTSSSDSTLIPCQRSFSNKKCKSRGQQGCLF